LYESSFNLGSHPIVLHIRIDHKGMVLHSICKTKEEQIIPSPCRGMKTRGM